MQPMNDYITAVRAELATGIAAEHAYRPALKALLEALDPEVTAVNDPKRIECGAPDFIITRGGNPEAYVEAKDIDIDGGLGKVQRGEQLKRYREALPNLILTDYLEFRWYVEGKLRESARLGELADEKTLKTTKDGAAEVESLLRAFLSHKGPVAGTAKQLAERMAALARIIRNSTRLVLAGEGESGQLHGQLSAFREVLVPDLSEDDFADMYAQTIAYGLFAARYEHGAKPGFQRQTASAELPPTNPFLRKLFHHIAGPVLDERIAWAVDDLADYLARAQMDTIAEDFSHQTGREDPVVHFYETFLREYDPKLREVRGVYYTPEPVVSYIVRSVDHILKTDFDMPLGLADERVFILDPACGTGTFLFFVIQHIHATVVEHHGAGAWPEYVRTKLLSRLFGFELLMAPYTIAHMKLAMQLRDLGYDFPDNQRLGIYLTNTLEEAAQKSDVMFAQFIADEANAAAEVKRDKPIMVVLGNPPYAVSSQNRGEWILGLLDDYKQGLNEKKLNLDDDYIKFLRFAQWRIDQTGHGVVGFITNNSYMRGVTHRRMRESLLQAFPHIHLCNLHGDSNMGELTPAGQPDSNVFDIRQGVAIAVMSKPVDPAEADVQYADLWGTRDEKTKALDSLEVGGPGWGPLTPESPSFWFVAFDTDAQPEWETLWPALAVFPVLGSGLNTDRDKLFIDFDAEPLALRMATLFSGDYDESFRTAYRVTPSSSYDVEARVAANTLDEACLTTCIYRPFDFRSIYYASGLTSRPVFHVHGNMLRPNVSLLLARQTKESFAVLCTAFPATHKIVTVYDRTSAAPLYLYPEADSLDPDEPRRPNLAPAFVTELSEKLGLEFIPDGEGDLGRGDCMHDRAGHATEASGVEPGGAPDSASRPCGTGGPPVHEPTSTPAPDPSDHSCGTGGPPVQEPPPGTFGPEDVFHYIYAVLHSPTYRERYAEFLKIDFPRIPLTGDLDLFRSLCGLGKQLVALHLLEFPDPSQPVARFEVAGPREVEKVTYNADKQRVHINKEQYFSGVEPEVYEFQVGGYQVLNKWLKDRKGRQLTFDDIRHYCRVVYALQETMRLMAEIDAAIPEWPIT